MALETIEGIVQEIIFYNADTGYTVLSLQPHQASPAGDDEIIVVGKLYQLQPGETVKFTGSWTTHKEYGEQFRAETMQSATPNLDHLQKLLGSGLVPGVGQKTAKQIIDHFGANAMDILDEDPQKILDVPGLKPTTAKKLANVWAEERKTRKVMLFLQNYGISAELSHKIYNVYGDDTIKQIREDPYRLALDVPGIDFKTADQIANGLGIIGEEPTRVRGGVIYALTMLGNEGHVFAPRSTVVEKAAGLLSVPAELCETAVTRNLQRKTMVSVKKMPTPNGNIEALYVADRYRQEQIVAARLHDIAAEQNTRIKKAKSIKWTTFFSNLEKKNNISLTEQQQEAVQCALTNKISVLTGGPGTGKTTTLRAVIEALDSVKATYALASPTGRAARRLGDATQRPASTIHRLLGYNIEGGFNYNEDAPLEVDMIIIDESSMIDLELCSNLLLANQDRSHVIFVGDVDQLPSVGAGSVLNDVINSGLAHVTRLEAIFRQANDSLIVVNAHRVNHGELPDMSNNSSDFFVFNVMDSDPEKALELLIDVVQNRIPKKFNLDPLNDVQVLAPMYRGNIGINVLNERLQNILNPGQSYQMSNRSFRIGDKVIQTRNNYEKDVYNGDIGKVINIDPDEQKMEVEIEGKLIEYAWKDAGELYPAYAISIHRSQGGEYPVVVVPVMPQHAIMLQRNLLYTAITRAKKLVVLVGTRRAIQMAVDNNKVTQRYSGLLWQLENIGVS